MEELQRVWVSTKYTGGIPIDIEDPLFEGRLYTTGQQWIEFYPDASEDIPNDMLEPKEWKPD
jgi:hypothetical protein